jgi:hypothetical protein
MRLLLLPRLGFIAIAPAAGFESGFRPQEVAANLGIVYAVATADVNRDGKPDVVAINESRLIWFENPSWTLRVVVEKVAGHDNVAVAPHASGGFALASDWQPANTESGGALYWVSPAGATRRIAEEPTLHRIRWADVDRDGRTELIAVPLHGRGAKAPAWTEGPGARVLVFRMPARPAVDPWPVEVAGASLHIAHNFVVAAGEIWIAASEGVNALSRGPDGKWSTRLVAEGRPGEIKLGRVRGKRSIATIEPWHGERVVVYDETSGLWARSVIDTGLNQGHALAWADFDGDGSDELAAGWRGKPWGLAIYNRTPEGRWAKTQIDGAVAVEDLAVEDLDGDGRPDLIAGGRATGNVRIYWNQAPRPR